ALVLMRGMLQYDYRVLLAVDAESALRLLEIDGLRVDLAIVDHNIQGPRSEQLHRSMEGMVPNLPVLTTASLIEDGVIKLRALDQSNMPSSCSLLDKIFIALNNRAQSAAAGWGDVSNQLQAARRAGSPAKVLIAGQA